LARRGIIAGRSFSVVGRGGCARSTRAPLTLLMLDIDKFKRINDTYGHAVGDAVLRVLCASVQRRLKPADTLVR
jgi:diguanylate cyclase (GGDEF)-like protein